MRPPYKNPGTRRLGKAFAFQIMSNFVDARYSSLQPRPRVKPPLSLRRLALIILIGVALASIARADDPPQFTSPEVNDYVKRQTAWMDEYIAALKVRDLDKKAEVFKKMQEDTDKNIFAIKEKLTNAEQPVYTKWRDGETKRMQDAVHEYMPPQ